MDRPLSPHLQIYRLPPTAILSILHRISGVFLTMGMLAWTVWLGFVVAGSSAYQPVLIFLKSPLGIICLYLWLFALFLHLCHGVRHLLWDSGRGLLRGSFRRHDALELIMVFVLLALCYAVSVWKTNSTDVESLPTMDWRDDQGVLNSPVDEYNNGSMIAKIVFDENACLYSGNVLLDKKI